MRFLITLLLSFSLFACVDVEKEDLHAFVTATKSKTYPINDKIPELKKIDPLEFTGAGERNPFINPKAEVVVASNDSPKSCPQPDLSRKKQILEMYSVDNLLMRGTLFVDGELWALIQVPGGEIHKVRPGNYLGLNHGKILDISKVKIELLELASDRNGCWKERVTQITLQSQ